MSKIVWPSEKDKYEAIGFLARRGVVQNIEANVPTKFVERFKNRFRGKHTSNQPYDVGGKKGGEQYRITLNHLNGCPEFLKKQVDGITKARINATGFIRELVDDYGFIFSCAEQNGDLISSIVKEKGEDKYEWFKSTYYPNACFLQELGEKINTVQQVTVVDESEEISNINQKKANHKSKIIKIKSTNKFSDEELQQLGWLGEKLFYNLVLSKNEELLDKLGLTDKEHLQVDWFNNGFDVAREWSDKSVGKGYDMEIISGKAKCFVEIKSSKKKPGYFTMTGKELEIMQRQDERYYLVKIDYLQRVLSGENVEIAIFTSPYSTFFKPDKIKSATFKIEGDISE